ncbi:MAG TPA: hypothetical protein EYP68_04270 [Candidatus Korarchaeota archaeon]|nr:hypothetical protein [Candidatus Korarchaeota archaeon]
MDLTFLIFAYTAGLFTFLSPCSFPMLPSYISYFLRRSERSEKLISLVFNGIKVGLITSLGFLVVLVISGSLISLALIQIGKLIPYFVIAIGMAFVFLGVLYIAGLNRSFSLFLKVSHLIHKRYGRRLGPFLYGVAYALAAMGCSLPLFLVIVSGSAAFGTSSALLSLASYFGGMVTLMIPISILTSVSGGIISQKFMSVMHYVERTTGLILLATGLYLIWYEARIILI